MNKTPEQIAREKIDQMLRQSGWAFQSRDSIDFSASQGEAIREYPTSKGIAGYVLFIGALKPVANIEAKRKKEGLPGENSAEKLLEKIKEEKEKVK